MSRTDSDDGWKNRDRRAYAALAIVFIVIGVFQIFFEPVRILGFAFVVIGCAFVGVAYDRPHARSGSAGRSSDGGGAVVAHDGGTDGGGGGCGD